MGFASFTRGLFFAEGLCSIEEVCATLPFVIWRNIAFASICCVSFCNLPHSQATLLTSSLNGYLLRRVRSGFWHDFFLTHSRPLTHAGPIRLDTSFRVLAGFTKVVYNPDDKESGDVLWNNERCSRRLPPRIFHDEKVGDRPLDEVVRGWGSQLGIGYALEDVEPLLIDGHPISGKSLCARVMVPQCLANMRRKPVVTIVVDCRTVANIPVAERAPWICNTMLRTLGVQVDCSLNTCNLLTCLSGYASEAGAIVNVVFDDFPHLFARATDLEIRRMGRELKVVLFPSLPHVLCTICGNSVLLFATIMQFIPSNGVNISCLNYRYTTPAESAKYDIQQVLTYYKATYGMEDGFKLVNTMPHPCCSALIQVLSRASHPDPSSSFAQALRDFINLQMASILRDHQDIF